MKTFKEFLLSEGDVVDARNRFGGGHYPGVAGDHPEGTEKYEGGEVVSVHKGTHDEIDRYPGAHEVSDIDDPQGWRHRLDHSEAKLSEIAKRPDLDRDSIHKLLGKELPGVTSEVLKNHSHKLDSDHIHQVINRYGPDEVSLATTSPSWGSEHTDALLRKPDPHLGIGRAFDQVKSDIARSHPLSDENVRGLKDHGMSDELRDNPNITRLQRLRHGI